MTDVKVEDFKLTARECPDTLAHKPDASLSSIIPNPGLPRATTTPTREHPEGVPRPKSAPSSAERTVLQQHVDFWDENRDGFITPAETWRGFRKLGFNLFWSAIAITMIHATMSSATHETWRGMLSMSINIKNMHRARHGSDSGIYDKEGRFVPQFFEDLFTTMDKGNKGGLTFNEGRAFIAHNRQAWDFYGWWAAIFEWGFLYMLVADSKGVVSKEAIRGQYDGSLFYKIAEQNEQLAKKKIEDQAKAKTLKQKAAQTAAAVKQASKQTVQQATSTAPAKKEL